MSLLLRTKLLTLSGVLPLGGLCALALAAGVVQAGNPPQAVAFGGPQQVSVVGSGFRPGATLQIQVLNPVIPPSGGPQQVLNVPDSVYLSVDPCGQIGEQPNQVCDGSVARLPVLD
jgi:hypothetical protein